MWPFKKEKWAVVKTLEIRDFAFGGIYAFYYLYESDKGNRKCEIKSSYSAKSHEVYLRVVYPWLEGRYDPEIPRYGDMPEEDLANALRGKLP